MGMPVTIEIVDPQALSEAFDKAFEYLEYIDRTFSVFKFESEISKINRGEIEKENWSEDMKAIFILAEKTKERIEPWTYSNFLPEKFQKITRVLAMC